MDQSNRGRPRPDFAFIKVAPLFAPPDGPKGFGLISVNNYQEAE
jgi:hypothetical protein